uniref:Protein FAR1-RELATED SEQUENCE n=5 Tax=Noccaea caerulescens TaxID=107243 RepID=A0A1J3GPJ1_NOCCA
MEGIESGDGDVQASEYLQTDETLERDDPMSDGGCSLRIGEALVCNSDHEIDVGFSQNEQRKSEEEEAAATGELFDEQIGLLAERKEFDAPAVGMEFESYDDAYNYYNCYATEVGFRVRVKNSWFKRRSKEKYGAVLCCSSQGFKRINDVNRVRKETRTGCPAMIRMRQVDSKRWRVLEVTLDHNHLLGSKICKSVKRNGTGTKRKCLSSADSDEKTIKLYRARVIDTGDNVDPNSTMKRQFQDSVGSPDVLNLRRGDSAAIYNYFCRMQLTNPNFFYLMDVSDEGQLRNVFWSDAFSRVSCSYFGDVIFIDNTYISGKFEIPLVTFSGVNHHGKATLLSCGLLAGETLESYHWLLKVCLSLMKCSPQTIVTDRCKPLEAAVSQVFPRSLHRFSLTHIMRKIPEKLGGLHNYDGVRKAFTKAVYDTLKVVEFEAAWGFMVHSFGVIDNEWLRSLYEDRARWAPVYLKDTFFAGIATARPGETLNPFFERYVHKQTPLKEFLDKYELALHKKHREETLSDIESLASNTAELKTKCSFETQLSRVYTRDMFKKFQVEVEEMYSCFSTTQLHVDGPFVIFLVKERVQGESNRREIRDFEVLYNRSVGEVRCICSCFNFYGYLCRHALCVLNFNGVEEVPLRYVLPRWRKDFKRIQAAADNGLNGGFVNGTDRVQWFDQLYKNALQVVEEGTVSLDHYKVAMQVLQQSLERVHSVEDKQE